MKSNKDKESVGNKKNRKIYWIIGIIIEIIIILIIVYIYFFNKPYDKIIECKIKSESNNTYTTEMKEIFYLKDNVTIKEKSIVNMEKLKNNDNVEVADKTLTFKINNDENFSLTQLTEEEILNQYTELGYICEES